MKGNMGKEIKKNSISMKKIKKCFRHQRDHSDCGVACLLMIIRYFGGESRLERLRELSGTNKQGTTLLGLYQAAMKNGLMAGAFEADIYHLKKLDNPCIFTLLKMSTINIMLFAMGMKKVLSLWQIRPIQ